MSTVKRLCAPETINSKISKTGRDKVSPIMDSSMSFAFPTPSETRQGCRYSIAQWEAQKPTIHRLYIEQDRTTGDIVSILEENGFVVTEKQLKDRLKKWKFNTKNIKERAMFGMARSRLRRRKFKAKPSIFIIDGKLEGDAKIDRFLKRNKISDSSLLSMTSPVDG
ncbi:hypothetical protein DL95DRAFT_463559 [Leptodontidium sp. 2 PMI_412]|nr:hypothetical protein DL95DRAFT_463559 [Leptodontidium sp. 2 PMI_412]